MTDATRRIDWRTVRETIDLAAVATGLLGPAPGRRGERGSRKFWWRCFLGTHEDANPSFAVEPGKPWWRCYGCGESGDAAALVMRVRGCSFSEAVVYLTGGPMPTPSDKARERPVTRSAPAPRPHPPVGPSGLPEADAQALVESAERRLWCPEGAQALAYLTGPERCLSVQSIRAARLGYTPGVSIPTRYGDRAYRAAGVVIPWFLNGRLALVKIRQSGDRRPKYAEAFRDPARVRFYPGPEAIDPGRPLVVNEGEFDRIVLAEALGDLASVVTLGSASARLTPAALAAMLAAPRWFVATDRDDAGDRAAEGWPACAHRVRPPAPFKDWTGAKAAGVDLGRWWREILAGVGQPVLFNWAELQAWRWGPAFGDPTPGIDLRPAATEEVML